MKPIIERGVTINGKHSYRDYSMLLNTQNPVRPPEPYTAFIDIPYGERLDLSEACGGTRYTARQIEMELGAKKGIEKWPVHLSTMYQDIQGKIVTLIFDDDKGFFYKGRAVIDSFERALEIGTVVISVNAEPYKYETINSAEPWQWDTFSFTNGIIRGYKDIKIDGTTCVMVDGTKKVIVPEINCSDKMELDIGNKTYQMEAGLNQNQYIRIQPGKNLLTFTGSGSVSITFRGCSL